MDQMESYRKKLKVIERIERVKHNSNGASRVLMKCMVFLLLLLWLLRQNFFFYGTMSLSRTAGKSMKPYIIR